MNKIHMRHPCLILIRLYKILLSPFLPMACRFTPTCSDYAQDAIAMHGAGAGTILAIKRICRCHPFSKAAYDPVPCKAHQ